jgi:hypothetical protein
MHKGTWPSCDDFVDLSMAKVRTPQQGQLGPPYKASAVSPVMAGKSTAAPVTFVHEEVLGIKDADFMRISWDFLAFHGNDMGFYGI